MTDRKKQFQKVMGHDDKMPTKKHFKIVIFDGELYPTLVIGDDSDGPVKKGTYTKDKEIIDAVKLLISHMQVLEEGKTPDPFVRESVMDKITEEEQYRYMYAGRWDTARLLIKIKKAGAYKAHFKKEDWKNVQTMSKEDYVEYKMKEFVADEEAND
jgi:hypothetical protein